MDALEIMHLINIMGYVRAIPDSAYFTNSQLRIVTSNQTVFWSSYFTYKEDV